MVRFLLLSVLLMPQIPRWTWLALNPEASAPDISKRLNERLGNLQSQLQNVDKYPTLDGEVGVKDWSYPYGDVRRYGAVGDGITDDTSALQNAVDSVAAALDTGNVTFPSGTFLISTAITLPRKVSLIGVTTPGSDPTHPATGSVLYRATDTGLLSLRGTNRTTDRVGINTIQGLKFAEALDCSTTAMVDTYLADSVRMTDCLFAMADTGTVKGHAIAAEESWDWRLTNVLFKYCALAASSKYCVYLLNGATSSCNDWVFQTTRFQESRGTSVFFDSGGTGTRNTLFWFTDCKFEDAQTPRVAPIHVEGEASNVSFAQCQFAGSAGRHVRVVANASNWTFNQCYFFLGNQGGAVSEWVSVEANRCVIANCHFDTATGISQYVTFDNSTGTDGLIIGCTRSSSGIILVNTNPPASTYVRSNPGFITEYANEATIVSGTTSIAVTHNLAYTPNRRDITVMPTESLGAATQFWISGPTSTQFTISVDVDPGTDVTFAWHAMRYRG